MKEIEKKYLLKDSIISLIDENHLKSHKITQFYTTITPLKSVRYRQMDKRFFKTVKLGAGASRDEEEVEISEKKFQKKFEDCIKKPIKKNRFMFHFEGKEYSIDVFKKEFTGLYILEIEFPSMEDFEAFKLPSLLQAHVIKDVTYDESFKNKNMVLYGKPQSADDMDAIFNELDKKDIDALNTYFIPYLNPIDALRVILYKFTLCILFYKKRVILYNIPEDLHQFRVNIRKARAFLKEFSFLFPKDQYSYFHDTLAQLASFTNQKRDLDVIKERLLWLDEKHDMIQQDINQQQENEHHKIVEMLKSEKSEHFFNTFQNTLKEEILVNADNTTGNIKHTAKQVIEKLHHNTIKKIDSLEEKFDIKKLHKIRIALKKLRYLLEEFQHIFGEEEIEIMIEKGKKLQTLLGDINDSVNQDKLLHNYFKTNKKKIPDSKKLEHTLLGKTAKSQKKSMMLAMKKLHKFKKRAFEL